MKKEISPAVIGIAIAVVVVIVIILGFRLLQTPGPKVPIEQMPVPKNPYVNGAAGKEAQ